MEHRNRLLHEFVDAFVGTALDVLFNQLLDLGPKADFHADILTYATQHTYSYCRRAFQNCAGSQDYPIPNSLASAFHLPSTSARVLASITISSGQGRANPSVDHLRVASIPIFDP